MKNKKVKVVCYGKEEEWNTREEAISFYRMCASGSEGAERNKYLNVLCDLRNGNMVCTDGESKLDYLF